MAIPIDKQKNPHRTTAILLIIYGIGWILYYFLLFLIMPRSYGDALGIVILLPIMSIFFMVFLWGLYSLLKGGILLLRNNPLGVGYGFFGSILVFFMASFLLLLIIPSFFDYETKPSIIIISLVWLFYIIYLFWNLYKSKKLIKNK